MILFNLLIMIIFVYMKAQALYTKELAAMYFANSTPKAATTHLKRWIDRNESLKNELTETGYIEGQRVFTPRQVELVFRSVYAAPGRVSFSLSGRALGN